MLKLRVEYKLPGKAWIGFFSDMFCNSFDFSDKFKFEVVYFSDNFEFESFFFIFSDYPVF